MLFLICESSRSGKIKASYGHASREDDRHAGHKVSPTDASLQHSGLGRFRPQTIPAGQEVIEYTGRLLSPQQMRSKIKESLKRLGKLPHCIFHLNPYWRLDGSVGGSGAERINHSCDPNLAAQRREKKIFYFSLRRIRRGEKLAFDYKYHPKAPRMICRCSSMKCGGTVNLTVAQ
jgi:SET domain-containing protein